MLNNKKIAQAVKMDAGLEQLSLASTNATGEFFEMSLFQKGLYLITAGAMAATKTVVAQVRKATDALGTGAADLALATVTITANVNVQEILVNFGTIIATDVIIINGVTYTADDTAPVAANGEFDTGADDDAAQVNLAAVIALLQPELLLTPDGSGGTGILTSKEPGEQTVSASSVDATIVVTTVKAQAFVEFDSNDLDDGSATHAAIKLTTDATIITGAVLLRAGGRYDPAQKAAASLQL